MKNIFKVEKDPFVDVIMPNYNKGQFLEEAINSVINQTYKNWYLYIRDQHPKISILLLNQFIVK